MEGSDGDGMVDMQQQGTAALEELLAEKEGQLAQMGDVIREMEKKVKAPPGPCRTMVACYCNSAQPLLLIALPLTPFKRTIHDITRTSNPLHALQLITVSYRWWP
jgi:hypothetical protein